MFHPYQHFFFLFCLVTRLKLNYFEPDVEFELIEYSCRVSNYILTTVHFDVDCFFGVNIAMRLFDENFDISKLGHRRCQFGSDNF